MEDRRGERIGWIGGFVGSFLWVLGFAILSAVAGRWGEALVELLLFMAAMFLLWRCAPWRNPDVPMGRLLLPLYGVFAVAVVLVVHFAGGMAAVGLRWWNFLWVAPVLTPLFVLGRRRWADGQRPEG